MYSRCSRISGSISNRIQCWGKTIYTRSFIFKCIVCLWQIRLAINDFSIQPNWSYAITSSFFLGLFNWKEFKVNSYNGCNLFLYWYITLVKISKPFLLLTFYLLTAHLWTPLSFNPSPCPVTLSSASSHCCHWWVCVLGFLWKTQWWPSHRHASRQWWIWKTELHTSFSACQLSLHRLAHNLQNNQWHFIVNRFKVQSILV